MMKTIEISEIVQTISELHETARNSYKTAGNAVILKTNWQIGRHLNSLLPEAGERNQYGERVLEQLSEQLNGKFGRGFSRRNLNMMRQFQQTYAKDAIQHKLTWTHYRFLLEIENEKERRKLEQRALRENLSSIELQRLVKVSGELESRTINERPTGKLNTYRIVTKPVLNNPREQSFLDLGFGIYTEEFLEQIDNPQNLKAMPAFQLEKQSKNKYSAEPVERDQQHLYLAYPERVVDGDTLVVKLDLGFGLLHRTRLRLSGVEAPERGTEHEQKIMRQMERKLKPCPVILVKTLGQERYGRWLAKILYLPGARNAKKIEKDGKYLNEELIRAIRRL